MYPALHRKRRTPLEPLTRGHKGIGREKNHHKDGVEEQVEVADRSHLPVDLLVCRRAPPTTAKIRCVFDTAAVGRSSSPAYHP